MDYMNQKFNDIPNITVIGAGVRGRKQMTLESIKIIQESSYVLYFPFEKHLHEWLTEKLGVVNAESLADLYKNGDIDRENYKRIVERILEVGNLFKNVAVLIPGHPYIGVSWIHHLNKMANSNIIKLNLIEGISSFDTMINDLRIDPLDHGATIIDANRLLLFQLQIETKIDLFIYHICSVGNARTDFENPSGNNRIELLQNYLKKFYSPNHTVVLVGSSETTNKSLLKTCLLQDLDSLQPSINVATSLFVPGISVSKNSIDNEFYKLVKSSER